MAVGWFIAPYKRRDRGGMPGRYCAVDDYTSLIVADGGGWAETEILGGVAVVKVRANAATLTTLAAADGVRRLPLRRLDDPVSSLSTTARTELRDWLVGLGYTAAQVKKKIGDDPAQWTLRDVLRMAASRRYKARYDQDTDEIVCDGPLAQCRPISEVDAAIEEG